MANIPWEDVKIYNSPYTVSQIDQSVAAGFEAKEIAQSVRADANAGRFDGAPGAKGDPGTPGEKGDPGTIYTPFVDASGNLSWTNNGGLSNPSTVNIKGAKGEQGSPGHKGDPGEPGEKGDTGAIYTPSVDAAGNLSWSNNGGLSNPSTVNIKGSKGDTGAPGTKGDTGANGATFTPSVDSNGNLSWTNDGGLDNPTTVNIKGAPGAKGDPGTPGAKGDPGEAGKDFAIKGYYSSLSVLQSAVPNPQPGDAYGIGVTNPYDIYIWDGVNSVWKNNGAIQGAKGDPGSPGAPGEKGDPGVTFTPSVDSNGNLSWSNNGGLDNPGTVNIKGTKGDPGTPGSKGDPGVTFTPSVDASGNLSWSNNGGLQNPSTVNIKGAKGDQGTPGAKGDPGTPGSKGDPGTTFTPSVDSNGNLSWTNNGGLSNPSTVNIKGTKGDQGTPGAKGDPGSKGDPGATFTPSVDSNGNLSWTNNGGLSNPSTVNIKGAKGDPGEAAVAKVITKSLSTSAWSGSETAWTQSISIGGYSVTSNTRFDILASPDLLRQAMSDGFSLVIGNDSGTVKAYIVGAKPTANLSVQLAITETEAI